MPRLPAHVEISGLVRAVQAEGGFAAVLARGEHDAGSILVVCCVNGVNCSLYERLPDASGGRRWTLTKRQDADNPQEFSSYLARRREQDPDLWIIELDIAAAERFIGINHLES